MKFDEAIGVHAQWKVRYRGYLAEPGQGNLNPDEVEHDDRCDLGNWLRGEGALYAGDPAFEVLAEPHRQFHLLAAAVERKTQAGVLAAEALLCGEYLRQSGAVISAIMVMKRHAEKGRA